MIDNEKMIFYILRMKGTDYYKCGITEDLKNRMTHYKSHNPINVEVIYLEKRLRTNSLRNLERCLSEDESIRLNRVKGRNEWYKFNNIEIKELIENITAYCNGEQKRFEKIKKQGKKVYVKRHFYNKTFGGFNEGYVKVLKGKDGSIYELH